MPAAGDPTAVVTDDYWSETPDSYIQYHVVGRRELYAPKFGQPNGPPDANSILPLRKTSLTFSHDGSSNSYSDSWVDPRPHKKRWRGIWTGKTVFTKVGIDQVAWNPIFGVVFFTSLGLMEGKSTDEIQTKIKNDLPTAVTGSWAYWVPAHFVNFRFIPGEQRLLYINGMQIMYNIFLSFLGNKAAPEEPKKD